MDVTGEVMSDLPPYIPLHLLWYSSHGKNYAYPFSTSYLHVPPPRHEHDAQDGVSLFGGFCARTGRVYYNAVLRRYGAFFCWHSHTDLRSLCGSARSQIW